MSNRWQKEDVQETQSWRQEARISEADCQAMLPTENKNLLEIIHMKREILGEDKDVIHIDVLPAFLRPKGIQRNLNILKG